MGQRSQIYIRYNVGNQKGLIARYFSWNYGERMISRARSIIEYIRNTFTGERYWASKECLLKLARICEVNFDMKDVSLSTDIIAEVRCYGDRTSAEIFNADNNDGQLLIDVSDSGIKYAFIDGPSNSTAMDGNAYMLWDRRGDDWSEPDEYLDQEAIDYTRANIKAISEMAELMTEDEVLDFLNDDYSYLLEGGTI